MLALGLYMAAALVGSLAARNADWSESKDAFDIYLYDNGIHTSIIFPRDLAWAYSRIENKSEPPVEPPELIDRIFESPTDVIVPWHNDEVEKPFPGNPATYPFVMVGWGDARFYRETPRWVDFRPGAAAAAVTGSGNALIHVDRLTRLPRYGIRKIRLTAQEISSIQWFIRKQLKVPLNASEPIAQPGYGANDRFFEATDEYRYSAIFTCNNWISEALNRAGVKTGYWTPLPFGVMWWH